MLPDYDQQPCPDGCDGDWCCLHRLFRSAEDDELVGGDCVEVGVDSSGDGGVPSHRMGSPSPNTNSHSNDMACSNSRMGHPNRSTNYMLEQQPTRPNYRT